MPWAPVTPQVQRRLNAAYLSDAIRQLNEAEEMGDMPSTVKARAYVKRCLKALGEAGEHPQPIWKRALCKLGIHGGPWFTVYHTPAPGKQVRIGQTCACHGYFVEEA